MQKKENQLRDVEPERIPAFNRFLGMDRVRSGGGHAEIVLDVREEFTNRRGVVHGGVITALLDSALGAAVISGIRPEEWCGTVQISVQFLRPGCGPRLTACARLQRRGLHLAFAEGTITDADDRTVATAAGTWYVWPSRPGAPGQE
jgi:acyl-CoA thioesterase